MRALGRAPRHAWMAPRMAEKTRTAYTFLAVDVTEVGMAIAIGIVLVAVGAVLVWGVDRTVSGVDASTIGVVFMAVGGVGAVASLLLSARPSPGPRTARPRDRDSLSPVEVETTRDEETPRIGPRWPH
jgi:hypothetical protein